MGTASPYIAKILPKFLIYCSVVFVQKIFKLVLAILLSIKKTKAACLFVFFRHFMLCKLSFIKHMFYYFRKYFLFYFKS